MPAYYSGDPTTSLKDAVRFWIGDTSAPWLMQDEEIAYTIGLETNPRFAAALCCDHMAGVYAQKITRAVGSLSINYSELQEKFERRAKDLRQQARLDALPVPFAGATDPAVMDSNSLDDSQWGPSRGFKVGMHDNPRVGSDGENTNDDLLR